MPSRLKADNGRLDPSRLTRAFDARWPTLEGALQALPPPDAPAVAPRAPEEKTDEILQLVRELARHKDREQALEALRREIAIRTLPTSIGEPPPAPPIDALKKFLGTEQNFGTERED